MEHPAKRGRIRFAKAMTGWTLFGLLSLMAPPQTDINAKALSCDGKIDLISLRFRHATARGPAGLIQDGSTRRFSHMTRASLLLFPPLLFALLCGCASEKHVIEIDDHFSMNIARVPFWFPGEGDERVELTATEESVLREKGNPDFIRFWWRDDGSFITSSDLTGRSEELPDLMTHMKKTWIYRRDAIEIEFLPTGGYLEHPMTEKLKLICDYGDPSYKEGPRPTKTGEMKETWTWVGRGIIVGFLDDAEVSRHYFGGSGEGTFLGH